MIHRLTQRVVNDVAGQLARWLPRGLIVRASVNVSVRDLDAPDLVDHVTQALRRHQVPAEQLQVEVTETALIGDLGAVRANLRALAGLGVTVSLDDFGTGYSSLVHLLWLPVTEVKIDRLFTSRMAQDP